MNDFDLEDEEPEFDEISPDSHAKAPPLPGPPGHSKWVFRLVIGALAYSIVAKAAGWPLPNLGFKLFQGFLTESSLLALVLLAYFAFLTISKWMRLSRDPDARKLKTAVIADFLQPGERLLWTGSPETGFFRSQAWAQCLFGVFPAAMGLLLTGTMARVMLGGFVRPVQAFAILMGVVFTGIGVFAMATPWRHSRLVRQASYGITDRRVLILRGIGWTADAEPKKLRTAVIEANPVTISKRARKRRSEIRVDIVFGQEPHPTLDGSSKFVDYGILAMSDWRTPESILNSQFGHTPNRPTQLERPITGAMPHRSPLVRIGFGVILMALISPWFLLGGGMILAGIRAIQQPAAAPGLAVALPAGIVLTGAILGVLIHGLWIRPGSSVRRFEFDGSKLSYATRYEPDGAIEVGEIRDVIEQRGSRGRGISGWAIRRFDRPSLYLPAGVSRAPELAAELTLRAATVDSHDLPV